MDLKSKLRHVMNFPTDGIDFIDITTVLQDAEAYKYVLDVMQERLKSFGDIDLIVGSEARGFIFGAPLAYSMGKGFVPIRKKGKLPYKSICVEYKLEYGSDILEIHEDAVQPGQRIAIVDDLLATGGTSRCNIELIEKLKGEVAGLVYFVELEYLNGRKMLEGYNVQSIVQF
ncbi:MAG: adenine phosphoribosyltransferase [Eubacteriales bacterium]|nr:adenine phosphoribosyltransferase [Eubacteriales bacterium]